MGQIHKYSYINIHIKKNTPLHAYIFTNIPVTVFYFVLTFLILAIKSQILSSLDLDFTKDPLIDTDFLVFIFEHHLSVTFLLIHVLKFCFIAD